MISFVFVLVNELQVLEELNFRVILVFVLSFDLMVLMYVFVYDYDLIYAFVSYFGLMVLMYVFVF